MVNSLGTRGCADAVDEIAALVSGSNAELAVASLVALGRIDSEAAVTAIAQARGRGSPRLKATASDAYLNCAARLAKQGKIDAAMTIYRQLFATNEPTLSRIGALTGMIAAQQDQAAAVAVAALNDQDPKVRQVAGPVLRSVPGPSVTKAIVEAMTGKAADVQVMLLSVLADRGDRSALPAVVKATEDAAPAIRLAALTACASLGDPSVVLLLLQRASGAADQAEQQAARTSLTLMRGDGINAEVARQLASGSQGVRVEAARALALRSAADQMNALFRAAEDSDGAVAAEAAKSLRTLATAEQMPALVKLLISLKDDGVRGEAENAVVAGAKLIPEGNNSAAAVLAALAQVNDTVVRTSLVRVLGRIGHAAALPTLYAAAQDAAPEVKDAAIRALAEWPTGEPAKVLFGIAGDTSASQVHRVLSLRGFVVMIPKQSNASDDQILDDYAKALQMAGRNEEKQLVLSKLALVRHRRALEMAQRLAGDEALKQSAQAAIQGIEKLLAAPARVTASKNPEAAAKAIDGDPATRWDTRGAMAGGEWFRIELDEEREITGLVLDTRGSGGDFPRGYEIYVSASSLGDGQLVCKGKGTEPLLKIVFDKPVRGRAIKILQTGRSEGLFWSIHELTIEPAAKK
jgi:HEAT repeat protein